MIRKEILPEIGKKSRNTAEVRIKFSKKQDKHKKFFYEVGI